MTATPFSNDHESVRTKLRAYVDTEIAPHANEWELDGTFPSSALRDFGHAGFLGLSYPEMYGGYGGDYMYTMVLAEELASCGSGSFYMAVSVQTDMATPPIHKFGTDAQRAEWLVPAIRGDAIGCIGITEPGAGSDVANIRTHARRDGSDWIINGSKMFITNGCRANFCTLVAKTDTNGSHGGVSLFILPMDCRGVQVSRRLEKVGMRASDTAELVFDEVRVPAEALLGGEGRGFHQIMWELQGERLIAAAGAVAGAQLAMSAIVSAAMTRRIGGRAAIEHAWLRCRIADAWTRVQATRQLVYRAADLMNRDLYPVREISMAKLASMRISSELAGLGMELAGEDGLSPSGIQRMWRDSRLGRIGGGTDEVMRDIVAGYMVAR